MSDHDQRGVSAREPDNNQAQGPNLKLLFSLIALAIVAAVAIAAMIVLPFYRAR